MQRGMLESVRCDVEERLLQIDWHCVCDVRALYGFSEDLEFWSWELIQRDYVMVGLRQRFTAAVQDLIIGGGAETQDNDAQGARGRCSRTEAEQTREEIGFETRV